MTLTGYRYDPHFKGNKTSSAFYTVTYTHMTLCPNTNFPSLTVASETNTSVTSVG